MDEHFGTLSADPLVFDLPLLPGGLPEDDARLEGGAEVVPSTPSSVKLNIALDWLDKPLPAGWALPRIRGAGACGAMCRKSSSGGCE